MATLRECNECGHINDEEDDVCVDCGSNDLYEFIYPEETNS